MTKKQLYEYWKSLTPYERNNKILSAIKYGKLDSYKLRAENNWEKHRNDFKDIKNIDEMIRKSVDVLDNSDRVLLGIAKDGGLTYNFIKGNGSDWILTAVDIDGKVSGANGVPVILHSFGAEPGKDLSIETRILRYLENNKYIEINNG